MNLDILAYQHEKMTTAMSALLSFELQPHQRIKGAMIEFTVALGPTQLPPKGAAFEHFEVISRIMGPVDFAERSSTLSVEERETLSMAFLQLDRSVAHAYYSACRPSSAPS